MKITGEKISKLVDRFLAWPLPNTVASDPCATNPDYRHPRSGTNLLNANEARAMIEYLLAPEGRNLREAAERLKAADPTEIQLIAAHDWDMIRDVAAAYLAGAGRQ